MYKTICLSLVFMLMFSPGFLGCAKARPPKPGPNFVWVPRHRAPNGVMIRGHWKYIGPPVTSGRHWVPAHYNKKGVWIPGHWSR